MSETPDRATLLEGLRTAQITFVTCEYNGESDSGQLDTPEFYAGKRRVPISEVPDLVNPVREFFYDLLGKEEAGWKTDDGAKGSFEWQIDKGKNPERQEDRIHWVHEERVIEYTYPDPRTRTL